MFTTVQSIFIQQKINSTNLISILKKINLISENFNLTDCMEISGRTKNGSNVDLMIFIKILYFIIKKGKICIGFLTWVCKILL